MKKTLRQMKIGESGKIIEVNGSGDVKRRMIDLDTLRKAKGYVLAIVDESTGEYKPVSSDIMPVIRCKDCALWDDADSEHLVGYCTEGDGEKITFRNEWCCWAERKE